MRNNYPTDLNEAEWSQLEPIVLQAYPKVGRPCKHSRREVLNAIFYVVRTGCQCRYFAS